MKIKLIALDLDGTLLNSNKEISSRNSEVIERCLHSDIHIVPSTGRTIDGIPDAIKNMDGVRYAVTTNGAVVKDLKTGSIISQCHIKNSLALELIRIVSGYQAMYDPYIEGRGISQPEFLANLNHYGLSGNIQGLIRKTRDCVPDIYEYVKNSKKTVEKINLFFAEPAEREKAKRDLEARDDIVVTSSLGNNLEINAPMATKGNGLKSLADYLGLQMREVMAAGDGNNDISMIRQAGIGVAMENSPEEVKTAADYITGSNDQDGVAAAIEKFVFS